TRHVLTRRAQLRLERRERHRRRRELGAGAAVGPLADGAVAGVALVFHVDLITVVRRAPRRLVLLLRQGWRGDRQEKRQYENFSSHVLVPVDLALRRLTSLRDHVHQRGLAALHGGVSALDRRLDLRGGGDRPLGDETPRGGELGGIDIRVLHRRAVRRAIHGAFVETRHLLEVHHFLVIGAVVVHHDQDRDLVMRRGPEHAGPVHEIAVVLDRHREDALVAVGERRADRRGRAVADTRAARAADEIIVLFRRPEILVPLHTGDRHAPFLFVLDDVPP